MIDKDAIFRQEALEFRARGRDGPGGVVRLGRRWVRRLYWAILALVVAGAVAVWTVHTQERAVGTAVVDAHAGTFAALLPAAAAPDLPRSHGLVITLPGLGSFRATVEHAGLGNDRSIRRAGLRPLTQPGILLTGKLAAAPVPSSAGGRLDGRAVAVLRSERVADVLARQFHVMLHGVGAGS